MWVTLKELFAASSKYFLLFITFDMQDLFSPLLITNVAQLELSYNMLLMATAIVLHYFTKTCFILELDLDKGSALRGVMELPLPSAALHQLLLTEKPSPTAAVFSNKIQKDDIALPRKSFPMLHKGLPTHTHTLTCFM